MKKKTKQSISVLSVNNLLAWADAIYKTDEETFPTLNYFNIPNPEKYTEDGFLWSNYSILFYERGIVENIVEVLKNKIESSELDFILQNKENEIPQTDEQKEDWPFMLGRSETRRYYFGPEDEHSFLEICDYPHAGLYFSKDTLISGKHHEESAMLFGGVPSVFKYKDGKLAGHYLADFIKVIEKEKIPCFFLNSGVKYLL